MAKKEILNLDELDLPLSSLKTTPREKKILEKQQYLQETNISVGRCHDCPVNDACAYRSETSITCGAANAAIKYFEDEVYKVPHISKEDSIGIRSLASIYASGIIAELYFKRFGSVGFKVLADGSRQRAFIELHTQYLRIQKLLQEGLGQYGLTPMGRKQLIPKNNGSEIGKNSLHLYLQTIGKGPKKAEIIDQKEEKQALPEPSLLPDGIEYHPLEGLKVGILNES
jgi:hypothetical protein